MKNMTNINARKNQMLWGKGKTISLLSESLVKIITWNNNINTGFFSLKTVILLYYNEKDVGYGKSVKWALECKDS